MAYMLEGRLLDERDALQDRLLRLAAEFDNYRKRSAREWREQKDRAAAEVLNSDGVPSSWVLNHPAEIGVNLQNLRREPRTVKGSPTAPPGRAEAGRR